MLNINKVMITGRLTRDPETKYLQSGVAVTNLSVAVNRSFQDKSGEWRDEVAFVDVEVWGKMAERVAETGRKGQPVYVEGRLKQDTWERDGQKQSKMRVWAETVKNFDVPQRGGQQSSDDGGESSYQSQSNQGGGGSQSAPARQQSSSSSAPSDGLHFEGNSNVSDDVPF